MNILKQLREEWPTVVALVMCYVCWFGLALYGNGLNALLLILGLGIVTTFYWSLVHEVIHGHPTRYRRLNELLVAVPLGWIYPVRRFRETHLDHHRTGELTDPFDDPESWYLSEHDWTRTNRLAKTILNFNNTLFGRMLIGPLITVPRFLLEELRAIQSGGARSRELVLNWLTHGLLCIGLAMFLKAYSPVPVWCFLAAAYLGTSLLLIRTFLEHQASEEYGERTVIIEKLCPIAFLFLFNSLHCVHHTQPGLPWYKLPSAYRNNRDRYISENNGYVYRSYIEVIAKYFFHAKEPVMHPHLRKGGEISTAIV